MTIPVLAAVWSLFLAQSAAAYIDPGTGSMILQLLAAGFVTVAVVFRKSIARVFGFLRRGNNRPAGK